MRHIYTDGRSAKAVDLENPIRDSWDFVEAMSAMPEAELYARVAAVNRAMNLTADATAYMNYAIVDKNGEDVDTFEDWQNSIGFMPDPRELIRRWRLSLFQSSVAYGRMVKLNALKKELVYVLPSTIKIVTKDGGLEKFERELNGVKVAEYSPNRGDFLYMWRLDHTTELLPTANSEFKALTSAAGILHAADWWTKNYFEHGAVKPTVLAVKGMVISDKKEELQSSWGRFVRSLGTRLAEMAKIINAETMDVKQIGDGLGDIKDSPVYRQSIENIALASGIPLSLLLANSANYATAETEYAEWYRDSITPWAKWMVSKISDQMKVKLEVRSEQSEPDQEAEVERAQAFQTYATALQGHPQALSIAAQIVGIDLPAGVEYDMLDKKPEPVVEPAIESDTDTDDELTAKAWDELDTWRKKAVRLAKRGKPVTFEFVTEHLPQDTADLIRKRLQFAGTPEEVKSAFDLEYYVETKTEPITYDTDELKQLADAINQAANELPSS
jgi:hypothetical protein